MKCEDVTETRVGHNVHGQCHGQYEDDTPVYVQTERKTKNVGHESA
jgi:hypothetical protein